MDVSELVITADDVHEQVTVHFTANMGDVADADKLAEFAAHLAKRLRAVVALYPTD